MDTGKITILRLENKTIGYICLNYPLIFIESQYAYKKCSSYVSRYRIH